MESNIWKGLRPEVHGLIEKRNYTLNDLSQAIAKGGVQVSELIKNKESLSDVWIPGVEVFQRHVFQQKGRGYFSELARLNEGVLEAIGLKPQQYASAVMYKDSAKGFHIHPPYVPSGQEAESWFRKCFIDEPENYSLRHYEKEQWDVMFILTSICEMFLVDERAGMKRRIMRFTIDGDSIPGIENAGVVVPPGVSHAIRCIGSTDLIMVYGTSTSFNPDWEGRVANDVESDQLAESWKRYLSDI